jgi:hypothetical protein
MGLDFADALGVDFCRRGIWLQRWACLPSSSPTCSTVRLASATPIASNGSRLYSFFALRFVFFAAFFAFLAFFAILPS